MNINEQAHYAHSEPFSTPAPGASARRTGIAPGLIFLSIRASLKQIYQLVIEQSIPSTRSKQVRSHAPAISTSRASRIR